MKKTIPARAQKRPRYLLRLLAFLATLALVLGAVFLVANYDRLNFDALRRWFTYRSLERSDSGQAQSFPCGGPSDRYVPVSGDLLDCSSNTVRLYSVSGTLYLDESVTLENPAADSAGSHALAYDVGGRRLYAYSNRAPAFDLELDSGSTLLSATVNSSGWTAVTSLEGGRRGTVSVYDPYGALTMQASLKHLLMDAAVSPDCGAVAILHIGLDGGNFESTVDLYPLEGGSQDNPPTASCPIGNNVILDLCWDGDGIWCLGESGTVLVSPAGTVSAACTYDGRYLKEFSLNGDGFAVMLLGRYRAGSSAVLTVLDRDGETASLPVEEQVLSLSAAGRYIAVLTADRLDIYTQDLTLYATLEGTQSARKVVLRPDGTAILISGETARLYVPE